jgi:flagellar hook-basal body complex protein FliE
MVDQSRAIGAASTLGPNLGSTRSAAGKVGEGGDFKSLLMESINEVNKLQAEAEQATTNLATGKTEKVAEVFTAVKKAELAFQTLMQIRNKLMDAYDEIKQIRI